LLSSVSAGHECSVDYLESHLLTIYL
jgi:hypothetical protein